MRASKENDHYGDVQVQDDQTDHLIVKMIGIQSLTCVSVVSVPNPKSH